MQISVIDHTTEPERTVASAARLCYSPHSAIELKENLTDQDVSRLIRMIINLGHFSVLEHATFSFGVEGISRVTSHQLVRHRVASYSQQSQRYVDLSDVASFIIPPSVKGSKYAKKVTENVEKSLELYRLLVEEGIPQEDARYFLPQAIETKIVISMNARELLHFFRLRCCRRAQWEIRKLACLMAEEVKKIAPVIFEKAGPSCVATGKCSEGKMTCGRPAKSLSEILNELS